MSESIQVFGLGLRPGIKWLWLQKPAHKGDQMRLSAIRCRLAVKWWGIRAVGSAEAHADRNIASLPVNKSFLSLTHVCSTAQIGRADTARNRNHAARIMPTLEKLPRSNSPNNPCEFSCRECDSEVAVRRHVLETAFPSENESVNESCLSEPRAISF